MHVSNFNTESSQSKSCLRRKGEKARGRKVPEKLACGDVVNKAALRGPKEFFSDLGREARSRRAGGWVELGAAIYHCFDFC